MNVNYSNYLIETNNMLTYMLDNGETLSKEALDTPKLLELMASMQIIQAKVDAIEKRLRAEITDIYECEEGKTKTNTDKKLGFKIEIKKPMYVELDRELTEDDLLEQLPLYAIEKAFPAKRNFSATGLKELDEDLQEIAKSFTTSKPGSVNVKVTKLII